MRVPFAVKRSVVLVGAGLVLAAVSTGARWASAVADDPPKTRPEVEQARALVGSLEAQLRATEQSLKDARDLLARLDPNADVPKDDSNSVEGVWRIVGVGGNEGNDFQKPPYDEYKIMSANHYLWLSFDPKTGNVLRSGGGRYTVDKGGEYFARVECSNSPDLKAVVGKEYHGISRVDGKRWYLVGRVPSGASFDELWERVH